MNEFDVIKAKVDIDAIKKGTEGVIVHVYEGYSACEVEFFDDNDETIDVVTCKFEQLELVKKSN